MADDDLSPFDAEPDADMVWMNHDGGMPAAFPRGSVASWQARGWKPCAAPPDVDPALIEHRQIAPQPAPEPDKKSRKGASEGVNHA